jgi:hypothetical protein
VAALATVLASIGLQPASGLGTFTQIYRCYNKVNGSHLYTAGDWEALAAVRKYPNTYVFEGPVYWAYVYDDPADPNDIPLYRFYNTSNGSHFYTISADEKAFVEANYKRTYRYEGVGFAVRASGGKDVHRFYNKRNGSHFYTVSLEEKAHVEATWPDVYMYEGIAFYAYQDLIQKYEPSF